MKYGLLLSRLLLPWSRQQRHNRKNHEINQREVRAIRPERGHLHDGLG
jgi:hypothetical protein